MNKLYSNNRSMTGQSFDLKKKIIIVGRGIDSDVQIKEKSISRKHLEGHSRGGKEVPNAVTSIRDYLYKIKTY